MYSSPLSAYGFPSNHKVKSGRLGTVAQSTVYCPFHDFVAPILWKGESDTSSIPAAVNLYNLFRLLFVKHLGDVARHDDQARTGVNSSTGSFELQDLVAEAELLKLYLPIALAANGN